MFDHEMFSTLMSVIIGLISGFISITRKMMLQVKVSKLWIISEFAGVIVMITLAMDVYPLLEPLFKSSAATMWITELVFVGVAAHTGSRMMWSLEKKFNKVFDEKS